MVLSELLRLTDCHHHTIPLRNMAGFLIVTEQKSGFLVATLAFLPSLNTKFDTNGTQHPIIFQKVAPEMWHHLQLLSALLPELMAYCWERQSWRWNFLMMTAWDLCQHSEFQEFLILWLSLCMIKDNNRDLSIKEELCLLERKICNHKYAILLSITLLQLQRIGT